MLPFHPHLVAYTPYAVWQNSFTPEECDTIRQIGELSTFQNARIGGAGEGVTDESIRNTQIVWIPPEQDKEWIFQRINSVVGKVNFDKFQLDLDVFDGLQYSKYEPDGHYDWHVDTITEPPDGLFRKLSVAIMLSDPDEYAGGDLMVSSNGNNEKCEKLRLAKGSMVVFYSHLPHKVAPVESGLRISLVTWLKGPKLR